MKFGKEKNQNILASNIEYFFNILIMKSLFHECLYFLEMSDGQIKILNPLKNNSKLSKFIYIFK